MPDFMNVDSARLDQASSRKEETGPGNADKDAVDQFNRSLQERKPSDQEQDSDSEHAESDTDEIAFQMPAMSMESLFSARMNFTPAAETQPAPQMPPGELAEKLVERILVGQTSDGTQEVRLRLSPDVLPGTEIRLTKDSDGMLNVTLSTDNASSFQTLVAAQDVLKARLEHTEGQVRVSVTSETATEDNDSRRRSRGLVPEPEEI